MFHIFKILLFPKKKGKHLEPALDGHIPSTVPAEEPKSLATAYGALLNEVHRAPASLCESARRLLALAIDMDTGILFLEIY